MRPPEVKPAYVYAAKLVRVVDGDTFDFDVDLGFHVQIRVRIRLLGVNCPELKGASHVAGLAAKDASQAWFDRHDRLVIMSHKPAPKDVDSFGRWLADVYGNDLDGEHNNLADYLLSTHNAIPYVPK